MFEYSARAMDGNYNNETALVGWLYVCHQHLLGSSSQWRQRLEASARFTAGHSIRAKLMVASMGL
jgi:hypothetical protein